jgi:methylmalonyl-CoA mutase cobalamin-binding domain/chain
MKTTAPKRLSPAQRAEEKKAPPAPIRLLTAVPRCDGHDSAINTINLEFIRHGFEVIYLGYHRSARDIARAAVQEDVRAVGISSYNGGHVEFFAELLDRLREQGADDVGLFGGGGGTITPEDVEVMSKAGVDRIFFAGTPLTEMLDYVATKYAQPREARNGTNGHSTATHDRRLARLLTAAEADGERAADVNHSTAGAPLVIGVTGPGGAGKTTLIDELVLRFLRSDPSLRIGVLSHDPSLIGNGALLGDRATMIYSQDDRVFMRSIGSRGRAGGLSPATERCLQVLKTAGGFGVIIVETVGIGQEALPFGEDLVDKTVFVMSPDYGSRLQLQKIVMLDAADIVVVNKSDLAGAPAASTKVGQRIRRNHRDQRVIATVAKRHRDSGVDELFALLKR